MASLFTTIYFVVYLTQSPNIALLSCLLQTLGIVSHLTLNILSCLLRTLAVWSLATVAHNSLGLFCYIPHTYCMTRQKVAKKAISLLHIHNLFLNLEECKFECTEIEYLGVIISHNSVHMNPIKAARVSKWPVLLRRVRQTSLYFKIKFESIKGVPEVQVKCLYSLYQR